MMLTGAKTRTKTARVLAVGVALAVLALLGFVLPLPVWVPIFYAGASVVTFVVYAADKSAARAGRRRVPERVLHVLGFVGGWPGALVAQQVLRHKTRKVSFQLWFWVSVVANVGVVIGILVVRDTTHLF